MSQELRWEQTQNNLRTSCLEVEAEASKLLNKGCDKVNAMTIPTADLSEWLSGSTEPEQWWAEMVSGPAGKATIAVALSQTDDEVFETCISLTGRTKSGNAVNVMYLIHFNEDEELLESSGVYYDFIDGELKGSHEPDVTLAQKSTEAGVPSEQSKWDVAVLDLGVSALRGIEHGPLTQTDINSLLAILSECQTLA